jgi:hypothetical protein
MTTAQHITFKLLHFRTIARDAGGPGRIVTDVLKTPEELDTYRATCASHASVDVDFSAEEVIAVARGACPLGCDVEIVAVVEESSAESTQVHIYLAETTPGRTAASGAIYPQHLIAVRRLAGAPRFRKVSERMRRAMEANRWLD